MGPPNTKSAAPAIVLCLASTGIAMVRALAESGVEVHAFVFRRGEPIHYSRYGKKVLLYGLENDEEALLEFLIAYAKKLGNRPVIFPTGDAHALLIAKNYPRLKDHCRIWSTSCQELGRIVNKNDLYELAANAGLATVPAIYNPTRAQAMEWALDNKAPYLLKPSYEGVETCNLREKNLVIQTREELNDYIECNGTTSLVIQRLLRGGDGHIFDCYGLCDREGRVVTLASHRRLRQHNPNFGATCFGEIPAGLPPDKEDLLFKNTELLLRHVRYHGIFGIEWLHDRQTGNFYLIDFNARPFSTIGHLHSCGVNLPDLAYQELMGYPLEGIESRPPVKHKYWIDFGRDIQTFRAKYAAGEIDIRGWLRSIASCRSFAYCDWRDPGPGMHSLFGVGAHACKFLIGMAFSADLE